jgi:hypothetical protein
MEDTTISEASASGSSSSSSAFIDCMNHHCINSIPTGCIILSFDMWESNTSHMR